ncbi:SPO11 meiotic protein covalently bound to DSB [Paragonimus kellicotti]|nr:SPO11 meiotic protein covalently bound to DSB [Paragonimus kellicotti]
MSELGKKFTCEARFVLVVEKDTIFQKLVNEGFYETYAPCLLMTAKGYPDLQTRCLLAELGRKFTKVPILGLFDADPHGLGVLCTYKYGTQNPTMRNSKLSPVKIEQMELLGVLPSELQGLQIRTSELTELTKADRALLKGIFKRSYFKTDNELAKQTIFMSTNGWKAEIEVLESLRAGYLCQEYLVNKLKNKKIFPIAYLS